MAGFILIDGKNIAYAAQSANKLYVGDQEVQAIYGFIRTIKSVISRYPTLKPIVLWDGISWRHGVFKEYKAARIKDETKSQQKMNEERAALNKQIPIIMKALEILGVDQMKADNYEADDLAGLLVSKFKNETILLLSGDKDWVQLVSNKVTWFDPMRDVMITPKNIEDILGVSTPTQWLEFRVLKGDVSDNISGVGGIGDVGAKTLLKEYGSVTGFINQYLDGTIKDLPKKFEALATDDTKMELYRRNIMLMDLTSTAIPKPVNLKIIKGNLDESGFELLCERLAFKSVLSNLHDWLYPFRKNK